MQFSWVDNFFKYLPYLEVFKIPLIMITVAAIVLVFVLITDMVLIWLERKVSARMQARLGPMYVAYPRGAHGWLQPIADAIKLLLKEDIVSRNIDKWVFVLAPLVVVVPAYMVYLVLPFSKNWQVLDLNIGIFYIISITSVAVVGVIMAGYSSNNKYALLSAMRSAAQLISYELPLGLSILIIVMLSGTLSMKEIVEGQTLPYILFFPVGTLAFLTYLISATAEVNRIPFDIVEAESELVAGFHIEYSGMKFAFFFLAEYANMFAISAIGVTLFLGGWKGPVVPFLPTSLQYFFWFLLKSYIIVFLLMWFRWTYPRLRVDQLMLFSWKFLLPVTIGNILLASMFLIIRG